MHFICTQFGDSLLLHDHPKFPPPTIAASPSQTTLLQVWWVWPIAVDSPTILSSNIAVDSPTILSSNIAVDSPTILSSNIAVDSPTILSSNIAVDSPTILSSNIAVDSPTIFSSNLCTVVLISGTRNSNAIWIKSFLSQWSQTSIQRWY